MNHGSLQGRKLLTGLCVLACTVFATGCYDRQELEEQAFVMTLGIDKAPNGLIDCTFRIALPQNPNAGGAKSGKTPLAGTGPVTIRAHTIQEALLLANSSIERTMSLTHLGSVIFSEDLAKQGLSEELQAMVRYREFRPAVLVFVSKGKAKGVVANDSPVLELSPSRMVDSIAMVGQKTGLIPVVYLHNFTRTLETRNSAVVLPIFSVNESVQDDPKGKKDVQGNQVDFNAGQVSRSGGNPTEWMGAAVFKSDKMVGELTGLDMIHLRMVQGQLKRTKLDFPDPSKSGYVSVSIRKERNPKVTLDLADRAQVTIDVPLDADILTIQSGTNYTDPAERQKLERYLSHQLSTQLTGLLERSLNEQDADIVPLSDYVRRKFSTQAAYDAYPWEKRMEQAKIQVNVNLHIRRFGVQLNPIQSPT